MGCRNQALYESDGTTSTGAAPRGITFVNSREAGASADGDLQVCVLIAPRRGVV